MLSLFCSRRFSCTDCGGIQNCRWPLLTLNFALLSLFRHCFSPTLGGPRMLFLSMPPYFSAFYGQHSVAAAWTNPSSLDCSKMTVFTLSVFSHANITPPYYLNKACTVPTYIKLSHCVYWYLLIQCVVYFIYCLYWIQIKLEPAKGGLNGPCPFLSICYTDLVLKFW